MANRNGAIARFLIKWLVIPVGLAAIGFFVVGPRLGKHEASAKPAPPVDEPVETKTPSRFSGEPEVEVTARPVSQRSQRRRSRRRTESRPRVETPAPESAPAPSNSPPPSPPSGDGTGTIDGL